MARRSSKGGKKAARRGAASQSRKRLAKRPTRRSAPAKRAKAPVARKARPSTKGKTAKRAAAPKPAAKAAKAARVKATVRKPSPRLDRPRRTLDDVVPTPPSSLDMERRGSAARSGRAELAATRANLGGMSDDIAGGDLDIDVEDAYFTGDEAPGGDNPSPDLEVVDDIGKALGVQYDDAEDLKSGEKIEERDKHRWEWDPASSEDYKERK